MTARDRLHAFVIAESDEDAAEYDRRLDDYAAEVRAERDDEIADLRSTTTYFDTQSKRRRNERDLARSAAVALEQENAVLRAWVDKVVSGMLEISAVAKADPDLPDAALEPIASILRILQDAPCEEL